jgi:acetolactate synthase small subunit
MLPERLEMVPLGSIEVARTGFAAIMRGPEGM